MPRNRDGFLKVDALKQGLNDQFAVRKGDAIHTVEILHDTRQGGFVTQYTIVRPDEREVHAWQVGKDLPRARSLYNDAVRTVRAIPEVSRP